MEQVIFGGYYDRPSDTATEYNSLAGGHTWSTTESWHAKVVSTDGVIKNLRVKLSAAPGGTAKFTFTLMLNGNPTALTFDIIGAATSGSNMVNEIDVTGGDTVSIRCVPTDTPVRGYTTWTCMFEGDTANESLILGGGASYSVSSIATEYGQVMGTKTNFSNVENNFRQVVPTSGTIKNFYVKLSADPGTAPEAYRFTLRKGGVSQTLTVTITADAVTGSDLVNSFAVVAGDVLTMMVEPLNSPSVTPYAQWGMTFVADTDRESIILGGSTSDLDNAATEYLYFTGSELPTWNADETQRYQLGQVCILKKLYMLLSAAPGAGNTYTFTVRIAGESSNVVVAVADAATTGNSGALLDTVANDDYVNVQCVPTDTPDLADAYWGLVCYREPPLTPKTSSDAGSGVDAKASGNPLATLARSEAGSGAEGLPARGLFAAQTGSGVEHILDRDLVLTEVGSGVETVLSLLRTMISDSGMGVENSYLHILKGVKDSSDTGSGVDASSLEAQFQRSEIGAGVEEVITRAIFSGEYPEAAIDLARVITAVITGAETGTGAETSLQSFYQKKGDSGSGVDTSILTAMFDQAETGQGAEAITLLAAMVSADSGVAVDAVLDYFRKLVDSGQGDEVVTLVGYIGRDMKLITYLKDYSDLVVYTKSYSDLKVYTVEGK